MWGDLGDLLSGGIGLRNGQGDEGDALSGLHPREDLQVLEHRHLVAWVLYHKRVGGEGQGGAWILTENHVRSGQSDGAGNLGRALIENFPFRANGFRLVAAFDVDPQLVDTKLGGVPVYHIDGMDTFVREHRVSVAVLTVPGGVAVDTARRLSKLGVDGIWNFTNVELPEQEMPDVKVENVHFADSLLTLSYMISED